MKITSLIKKLTYFAEANPNARVRLRVADIGYGDDRNHNLDVVEEINREEVILAANSFLCRPFQVKKKVVKPAEGTQP